MRILFFARARDLAGTDVATLEGPATVAELRVALVERFPRLEPLLPHCAIAIDDAYAANHAVIPPEATVALLPPVSGG